MTILKPLMQQFINHTHGEIRKHGLIPMGTDNIKQHAEAGHKVLDSSKDAYHLGCGRGFASDTRDDQIKPTSDFADLCQPTKNWRLMYNHDPLANLSPEAVKNVRGGEVATWTETIDPTSLDTIVWPRAAAAAEVWWSGRSGEDGILRSIYNARPRLDEMRQGMLARGINAALIVAGFCGQSPLADCA